MAMAGMVDDTVSHIMQAERCDEFMASYVCTAVHGKSLSECRQDYIVCTDSLVNRYSTHIKPQA